MDADKVDELLLDIANLSVDIVKSLKGKYDVDLLQSASLMVKYLLISKVNKEYRGTRLRAVSNENNCPLCVLFLKNNCKGCILKDKDTSMCGHEYDGLNYAVKHGTFIDTAFNISTVINKPMNDYIRRRLK